MRKTKWSVLAVLFILVTAAMATVSADVLPQNVPETMLFTAITSVDSDGFFSADSSLDWRLSSEFIGVNLILVTNPQDPFGDPIPVVEPEPPLNAAGEVQDFTSYHESTVAIDGIVRYDKDSSVDSSPHPTGNPNIEYDRLMGFDGQDNGRMISHEDIMMSNVGNSIITAFSARCPFANASVGNCIPSFCNRVESGSDIDMSEFSAATVASVRNVNEEADPGFWPPIPVSDDPAQMHYEVRVTGAHSPAVGMASAFSEVLLHEGGARCPGFTGSGMEFELDDRVRVDGLVDLFDYHFDYESGIRR